MSEAGTQDKVRNVSVNPFCASLVQVGYYPYIIVLFDG